ncbi:MAG: hypothetical protein WAO67_15280 [Yoonia sp.]|jgi:ElaB/YqjD/DUF883 family membrane-anchored ribosome-binding protein
MAKAQSNKSSTAADNDLAAVIQQLAAMREDIDLLAQAISNVAQKREATLSADFAEGLNAAKRYVETTGKSAERQLEGAVAVNPLLAIALAAGAGFLAGALVRR